MKIEDKLSAQTVLSRVSYYRFSAFFLPFKGKDGNYKSRLKGDHLLLKIRKDKPYEKHKKRSCLLGECQPLDVLHYLSHSGLIEKAVRREAKKWQRK
jgi:hypothetical protein